jgi:hypothetical protein
MKNRPISIAIIAWFMIVSSIYYLIVSMVTMYNPAPQTRALMEQSVMPIPLQYGILFMGLAITLVSGIAILKRQNWARFLYVIWGTVGAIVGLIISPTKIAMVSGIVFLIVAAIILFRPKVNDYFTGIESA